MKLQYYIVLWQHTLQKYRNGCCQECKYNETQYSKLTVKASKVSLSLPNVQTIDVTVWRLSLSHGEVMIDYVINDCCPNFIRASYMNATQGPLYFYYGLFLVLVLVLAEVHTGPHWWQGETVHCRTDFTFLLYIETCHFDFLQYPI